MEHGEFAEIMAQALERVSAVLGVKTEEYARKDQLHNIRLAALLQGESLPEAVAGMMVKHTVSIFTMVKDGTPHPEDKWDEKITDHIIWLVLLKAALIEGAKNPLDVKAADVLRAQIPHNHDAVDVTDLLRGSDGRQYISAAEILRYATNIVEDTSSNPNQGTLSC